MEHGKRRCFAQHADLRGTISRLPILKPLSHMLSGESNEKTLCIICSHMQSKKLFLIKSGLQCMNEKGTSQQYVSKCHEKPCE